MSPPIKSLINGLGANQIESAYRYDVTMFFIVKVLYFR